MYEIPYSEFRKLNITEIQSHLPMTLTRDGVPCAVLGSIDNIIVLDDVHPRMKTRLISLYKLTRATVKPSIKISASEIHTEE